MRVLAAVARVVACAGAVLVFLGKTRVGHWRRAALGQGTGRDGGGGEQLEIRDAG